MTTTYPIPRGIHRRAALSIGLALVRWSSGCRELGRRAAAREAGVTARDRDEQIRRYEIDQQVRLERDRTASLLGVYTHSVM